MADPTDSPPPSGGGSSNKLTRFIKKNKTLSIVIGIVGGYFAWHELNKPQEGEPEGISSTEEPVSGSALGPESNTDVSHEAIDEELRRIEDEAREDREDRVRQEEQNENKGEGGGSGETNPGEEGPTTETDTGGTVNAAPSVTVHGKTFPGATGSHVSGSGKTDGGKEYIEYTITYPGRQERWQYFTATGNWRQANNSATGPGANKKPEAGNGNGGGTKPGNNGQAGSGNAGSEAKPPVNNPNHPDAVNTGNRAVNGGIGSHTAPAGYHLFAEGGWIWRAKNVAPPVAPAQPVGGNKNNKGGGTVTVPRPTAPAAPRPVQAAPVPAQQSVQQEHPNAVNTGNRCVSGGVGGHTAPKGYHLFCAKDGNIWRAPN